MSLNDSNHEEKEGKRKANLLQPLTIRGLTLRNRLMVSPMCQYSSADGFATDWHLVHLGSRAVGGAALVMTEATAVEARGRISPDDLGIYHAEHGEMLSRVAHFIRKEGALAGIQLAHAGRKASTFAPWQGKGAVPDGWTTIGPLAERFSPDYPLPVAMTAEDISTVVASFILGARRALQAGFQVVEIHAAHGYLLHEFLSPLTNRRTDEYGGSAENRCRFLLEVVRGVREVWPQDYPLFVRLSAVDWHPEGLQIADSVATARLLAREGVDLIDVSSGGNIPLPPGAIPLAPGYQVPFAAEIKEKAKILTAAVGLIEEAHQAEAILEAGQADLIAMAREFLRDPYFPLHAATALGVDIKWPVQYERAKK